MCYLCPGHFKASKQCARETMAPAGACKQQRQVMWPAWVHHTAQDEDSSRTNPTNTMWVHCHQRNSTGTCHWRGLIMVLEPVLPRMWSYQSSPATEHRHIYCRQWSVWYNWDILQVFLQLSGATVACDEHKVHIIFSRLWIHVVHGSIRHKTLSPTIVEVMFLHSTTACEHIQTRTFFNFWTISDSFWRQKSSLEANYEGTVFSHASNSSQ